MNTNRLEKSILLGIIFTILFNFVNFSVICENISSEILRLHIIANSNSEIDQNIKFCIRDKVQNFMCKILSQTKSKEDAKKVCKKNLHEMKRIAEQELKKRSDNYKTKITVKQSYFKTREYEHFILPAGNYDALEIKIGEGKGKNWWCILFPVICVGTAKKNNVDKKLSKEEVNCIRKRKFKAKFKILEICKNLKQKINK